MADPADPLLPERRAVRRAFARAARTYDAAAVLQREVGARMMERLEVVKLVPSSILDAGCGTGDALGELAARYPRASRIAVDVAPPMLAAARAKTRVRRSLFARLSAGLRAAAIAREPAFVCADVAALPFEAASFELVWSNLTLQWVAELDGALAEMHRVLAVGGLITFTTFGPDTLKELRSAFAQIDAAPHVARFIDMHDIGDLLVHTGFADPVMQMETITMTYARADGAVARPQGDRRDERRGGTFACADRAASIRTRARRARRACARRPHTGDVRGHLRPRLEGRAKAHARGPRDRASRPRAEASMSVLPQTASGVFVTGTDTGVGKTFVAAGIARALARAARRVAVMKPVAAGIEPGARVPDDVATLVAAANVDAPLADVNPYAFAPAIAPHIAAAQSGTAIDVERIAAAYARLAARADVVVVEGAGGALVPLGARTDMLDIAIALRLPVLLVVAVRLGCLNHAILTDIALRMRGVRFAGWIANRVDPSMPAADENVCALTDALAAPMVADIGWNDDAPARLERAVALLALRQ